MEEDLAWRKQLERRVASLSLVSDSLVSVGFEEGSVALFDLERQEGRGELVIDPKFPVVDHCWTQRQTVCATAGKTVCVFDCEKKKPVASLLGHQDVAAG